MSGDLWLFKYILNCYFNWHLAEKLNDEGNHEEGGKYLQAYYESRQYISNNITLNRKLQVFRELAHSIMDGISHPFNPSYVIEQKGVEILTEEITKDRLRLRERDFPIFVCNLRFDIVLLYIRRFNVRSLYQSFLLRNKCISKIVRKVDTQTQLDMNQLNRSNYECLLCMILHVCMAFSDIFSYNFKGDVFEIFLKEILCTETFINHHCACLHNLIMFKLTQSNHLEMLMRRTSNAITIRSCCVYCIVLERRHDLLATLMTHSRKNFNELHLFENCQLLDSYTDMVMAWCNGLVEKSHRLKTLCVLRCYAQCDILELFEANGISLNCTNPNLSTQLFGYTQGLFFRPFLSKKRLNEYLEIYNIKCIHSFDVLNTLTPLLEMETYIHFLYKHGVTCDKTSFNQSPFTKKIRCGEEIEAILLIKNSICCLNESYNRPVLGVLDLDYVAATRDYYCVDTTQENSEIYNTDYAIFLGQFNVLTYLITAGAKFNHFRLSKFVKMLENPHTCGHTEMIPLTNFIDGLEGARLAKFNSTKTILRQLLNNPNKLSQLCANKVRDTLNFPLTRINYKAILKDNYPPHLENLLFLDHLDFNYIHPPTYPLEQQPCFICNI